MVLFIQFAKALLMWVTAIRNQFFYGQSTGSLRTLRQNGHLSGHFYGGQRGNSLSIQQHGTALHRHHPGEGFQQRGFAAAIGANDGSDLSFRNLHIHLRDDDILLVADRNALTLQAELLCFVFHMLPCYDLTRRYRKYGAPITAATMPMGISLGESSVREMISEKTINTPPVSTVVPRRTR